MTDKTKLINKYRRLCYKYGEYDTFDYEIEPKLAGMTTNQIQTMFMQDQDFFKSREMMIQA